MLIVNIPALIDHKYPSPEARLVALVLATYSYDPQSTRANKTQFGPVITNTIWPGYFLDELAEDTGMSEEMVELGLKDMDRDEKHTWVLIPHTPFVGGAVTVKEFETYASEVSKADKKELAAAIEEAKRELAASRHAAVAHA
ncbi:hypothetical protein ACWG8W_06360 [Citricoccus zhacaiensis]